MNEQIIQELEEIIAIGEKLIADASVAKDELGHERIQELRSIVARGGQLIERLYGSNSYFSEQFKTVTKKSNFDWMDEYNYEHVAGVLGILKAVKSDIKSGFLTDFRGKIRAEIFADFLKMAEQILDDNKDAAAVLLGAVLENSLRKIASANGIDDRRSNGKPLTIDPLNIELARNDIYTALVQKQITTWADLRNKAMHGKFDKYDTDQVKQMLLFVQKFCADYLK